MKPEKMTDEDVRLVKRLATEQGDHWPPSEVLRLLAHIAALEAERERWERDALSLQDSLTRAGSELRELTGDRDRLLEQRDAIATNLGEARAERDALRERVQALEANLDESSEQGREWLRERDEARDELAAIRQRAETWRTTGRLGDESRAALDYVPRDVPEVRAEPSTVIGTPCDCSGTPGTHEAGEACIADEHEHSGLKQCDPSCSGWPSQWMGHSSAEPTTAEAFAAAREAFNTLIESTDHACRLRAIARFKASLSLLERRMGAMASALKHAEAAMEHMGDVLNAADMVDGDDMEDAKAMEHYEMFNMLKDAALADAPPVFTLEEVHGVVREEVMTALLHEGKADAIASDVAERLSALRR